MGRGLAYFNDIDPGFDEAGFLDGAARAYEMILTAFADDDLTPVRDFLGAEVAAGFEAAIGARRAGGRVRSEVLDSGPGIPERDRARIFQEFQRLAGHDARGERGFGLGLAICQRIASLLDAPLLVRSVVGRGSAFSLTLPRAEPGQRAVARPAGRRASGDLDGLRVLCIDNDLPVLQGMRALLHTWGCEVELASGSVEAWAVVEREAPDVVIADYHLDNGLTGVELLQELRAQCPKGFEALVVTADHGGEADAAAQAAGYRVLKKPVRPGALRALLARLSALG